MTPLSTITQTPYLRLRRDRAPKLGQRAIGGLTYEILANPERTQLFLTITGNEGGGNWNREVVPMRYVEEALDGVHENQPFSAKVLQAAFVGRSTNNAGFLAAALAKAGLVAPAPDVKHKLVRVGDWGSWKAEQLTREGESILIPPALPDVPTTGATAAVPVATPPAAPLPAEVKVDASPKRSRKDRPVKVPAKANTPARVQEVAPVEHPSDGDADVAAEDLPAEDDDASDS